MDLRTMIRELDEIIARARSAAERETTLLNALPDCDLLHRKQKQPRARRNQMQRLRGLRSKLRTRRRAATDSVAGEINRRVA